MKHTTKYYAGVGARNTPQDVLQRMSKLSGLLARKGYTLRSGGALGADTAFEVGCGDSKEIFTARDNLPMWANVFTEHFHPKPRALKEYPWKLMTRNALQVLGRDGNTPVEFLVCWTADGEASGGTGHAMRIAKYFAIPVYNFYHEEDVQKLKEYLR